jgi:hypothetical protein
VSRILVIGGYGGFGARLCRRLAAAGHELVVAGRSAAKAADFCSGLGRARPLFLDRRGDVGAALARERVDLVIDAAGPFQDSDDRVPRACIDLGLHYLDLADGRDFVAGIGRLDARARAAGVAIVAGASSLPALSGAVARRLAEGLDRVHSVDIALSTANRSRDGDSVVLAALSYAGRPLRLWRGGRWVQSHGWQEMRRENFPLEDGSGLRCRLVALADVPDLDLLPDRLPGRPSVTFRAGTELGFQMRALGFASALVHRGWLGSLRPAARWLLPLYRLTFGLGGERSAMKVTLKGSRGGAGIERQWTIVAERGEGFEIPTLAAAILAERILAGAVAPGARDAASLLALDDFEPAFAGLAVRHETIERPLPPPLYARAMGPAFERLPPALRAMHDVCGDAGAAGEGMVERGRGWPARLIGAIMRFPPAGRYPVHVAFAETDGVERWTRDFGGHLFASELSAGGDGVAERFGPIRFAFALPSNDKGLAMELRRWSLFHIPLPLFLAPRIAAREWQEENGRFGFDVRVSMPLVGPIVRYAGWLSPLGVPPRPAFGPPAPVRSREETMA